ncbi:hypothetical protein N9N67_04055 [Bacteriovoracaceae bacterium]|nr:hypothetical protein [Bacteriovoracaceae bacterium]
MSLKKSSIYFFLLSLPILLINSSYSNIYLEPYAGIFVNGRIEGDTPSEIEDLGSAVEGDSEGVFKMTGNFLGARAGLAFGPIALGADVLTSSSLSIDGWSSGSLSESGVFLAYEFPVLLRVYYTYIVSSTLESVDEESVQTFSQGSGSKLGLGVTILPLVSINIELKNVTYSEYDYTIDGDSIWDIPAFELIGVDDDWADNQNTLNSLQVSVSFPFDF